MSSKMPQLTMAYGVILIIIGVAAYFATGQSSATALIPAFLGTPVLLCGVIARNERFKKHAMHGAVLIGLLGMMGTFGSPLKLPGVFDGTAERPVAVIVQALTLFLSFGFVVVCVRSFIEARRNR